MTPPPRELRAAFPGWFIWPLGTRWWAMHPPTATAVCAGDLDALAARVRERLQQTETVP
jgi:hypothetical protein